MPDPRPDKTYRIGEAARMLNLKTHVLRFWESEFKQLKPRRTEKGQRFYSHQDVELLRTIQQLLHVKGLTIDGAKKVLADRSPEAGVLKDVIAELTEIRDMLASE